MTPSHIAEYRQNRTAGVDNASDPHRTILLLLQGAIERVRMADRAMEQGDFRAKLESIDIALDVIDVLRASLDHQAGGEIAGSLEALYVYMGERLVQANAANDRKPLAEVINLLSDIVTAWAAIPQQLAAKAK